MVKRLCLASIAILFCRFDLASGQAEAQGPQTPSIRTVSTDTLLDAAIAYADPADPVVYYNPRLMERLGSEMSVFVLTHEEAHIRLGHRRPSTGMAREALQRLLQSWELEADCLAASWLVHERPSALQAATDFFRRMGPNRLDREHPTGSARADRLEACGQTPSGDPRRSSEGPRVNAIAIPFK
jgi:hypothetical protein